ncbi:MAG: T9SS type A sorting domain-containing protein [Bacteroidales bacterium]|nr:T9SS type A sorting domain-containing protein [Bacteroidales bacterium]
MKIKFCLVFFIVVSYFGSFAQNYLLNFKDANSGSFPDSIYIENLSTNEVIALAGNQTLSLVEKTAIANDHFFEKNSIKIFPNPFVDYCNIVFNMPRSGGILVNINDLTGKRIVSKELFIEQGLNNLSLSGLMMGAYIVNINSNSSLINESTLIFSKNNNGSEPKVELINFTSTNISKSQEVDFLENRFKYNDGQILLIKALFEDDITITTLVPTTDQTVEFVFSDCIDMNGQTYATVVIGDQIWMAENLNLELQEGSWENGEFSKLYPLDVNSRICPSGWHIPSYHDWLELSDYLGGDELSGEKLKSNNTWYESDVQGNNISGFSALPGGFYIPDSTLYYDRYFGGYWWSNTEYAEGEYVGCRLSFDSKEMTYYAIPQEYGLSVRCIKDSIGGTAKSVPTVVTLIATDITENSALMGGSVTKSGGVSVTQRGICWSKTNTQPDFNDSFSINDSGLGEFYNLSNNLESNTIYFYRAYATNMIGTAFGVTYVLQTASPDIELPTVITGLAREIQQHGARLYGELLSTGGDPFTQRGMCWSKSASPSINDHISIISQGLGQYSALAYDLEVNTTYYYRAYATNGKGTSYGQIKSFKTKDEENIEDLPEPPVAATWLILNITENSATFYGSATPFNSEEITNRGFLLGQSPDFFDQEINCGTGEGDFSNNTTNLLPETKYYVKAFAENNYGRDYGIILTFVTKSTPDISEVTIGSQTWMKYNLDIDVGEGCWDNAPYGKFYTWEAAMNACPTGWHLPSDEEWKQLKDYLISNGYNYDETTEGNKIAKALASNTDWETTNFPFPNGNIGQNLELNNKSGFNALPAGYTNPLAGGTPMAKGSNCFFWTTYNGEYSSKVYNLSYMSTGLFANEESKEFGYSVRCIKD